MANFHLQIITQERISFDDEVTSIVVPGEAGYLGVLANHAPLLAALGQGKLTVKQPGNVLMGEMDGGFIEVHDNKAVILADSIEGDFIEEES